MICYRCNDALSCKTPEAKLFRDEDGVTPCVECLTELVELQNDHKDSEEYQDALGESYWAVHEEDCDD